MTEVNKLDLQSLDITELHKDQLKKIFPEVFNEDKIDFEKLRVALGDDIDMSRERFGMTWPGKTQAKRVAQEPSTATLKPDRDASVNFDTTQNLFIEGDNLEVLKLLQKSYFDKIKMIYIDPPYNTGNEFIYPDKYEEGLKTYLQYTGQVDAEGKKFSSTTESDGRYHSKWMNMMWPRLALARNLLTEDGVIFISIDDHEVDNLKKICNEIFGEENFVAQIIWQTTQKNDPKFVAVNHEYILLFVKNIEILKSNKIKWRIEHPLVSQMQIEYDKLKIRFEDNINKIQEKWTDLLRNDKYKALSHYKYVDKHGAYFAADISDPQRSGPMHDFVIHPITGLVCKPPAGGYSPREIEMKRRLENDEIHFGPTHENVVCYKKYLTTAEDRLNSVYYEDGRRATKLLESLLGKEMFDYPKSELLVKRLIGFSTSPKDIVLDFFAGSATTAHAVMQLNAEDGGNRKFIMTQLPELVDENSEAYKAGYRNIAQIGEERIRRAGAKIVEENKDMDGFDAEKFDCGFKVYKLTESNFMQWDGTKKDDLQNTLKLHVDHIAPHSTEEDLLSEILLKSGHSLTEKIEEVMIDDKKIYIIGNGDLIICLEKNITKETMQKVVDRGPKTVICLNDGFEDNADLTNVAKIMENAQIEFRTV